MTDPSQKKENETLLKVPSSARRTAETVPKEISSKLPKDMRVHGLLAADLALDRHDASRAQKYAKWNAVVPTREDVWQSLPLTWDPRLRKYLPKTAADLLRKQEAKFNRDWELVQQANLGGGDGDGGVEGKIISREDYLYAWLLVNTRSFYHETARSKKLPREDRMVLQPVADLFNHSSDTPSTCRVNFSSSSRGDGGLFTVATSRAYKEGDEVYITYGNHGNDFLLTEYGFLLGQNQWDEVCLDEAMLPELSAKQKDELDEAGFLGNYMLDDRVVCYRTQVALRRMVCPAYDWRMYLDGEEGDEAKQRDVQRKVDKKLIDILNKWVDERITRTMEALQEGPDEDRSDGEGEEEGTQDQRDMLCLRWRQIRSLVARTVERLEEGLLDDQ